MIDKTKTIMIRAAIALIVGVIAVIYYMSEVRPFPYAGYDTDISELQRFDAELNEAIVLTRFGTIKYYDPIVQALNHQENVLRNFRITLKDDPNPKIEHALSILEQTVAQKRDLTEQFERINPILTNAISRFSKLLSEVIESESNAALIESGIEGQYELDEKNRSIEKANNLFRGILIYVSHRTEDKYQDLMTLIDEISELPQKDQLPKMDLVLNYARKILELQPQMTRIDTELFQIPVVPKIQILNDTYESEFAEFSDRADAYRVVLYIMIISLLTLLRWTFARLQKTVVTLHEEVIQKIAAQEELAEINRELENRVAQRTEELSAKNLDLNQALSDLKDTQDQLIIKEKMASVGMLTTGIAHEIKNPLNFVNNFSEISIELVSELNQELEANKEKLSQDALGYIQDIIGDLKTNCTKIKEHGVRADNIVKMMLMHSQETGVQKEMINFNTLVDDNLRIAVESFSAAQGKFEPKLEKNYDEQITEILAAPQTLGRAFIYIIDNALYALKERQSKNPSDYFPTIWVTTKKVDDNVTVTFKDNGMGIAKQNVDRIFEPFFTTKPTGKGNTGLGLSICYDTVVKQHKGEMKVRSEEGAGTEMTVTLPIKPTKSDNA